MSTNRPSIFQSLFSGNFIFLVLAFICAAFTSPRLGIAIFPWLALTFLMRYIRKEKWWKAFVFGWLATWIAGIYASSGVMPFPFPILVITNLVASLFFLIPYLMDKWLHSKFPAWVSTFIFPSGSVLIEFLASQGGGGTWGNIAYLQFSNTWLIQLASVTGIWGISFMVYWFASSVNTIWDQLERRKSFQPVAKMYGGVLLIVLGFGFLRLQFAGIPQESIQPVAGITAENLPILEQIHFCETGEQINISPKASQSDPELAKAFTSMIAFVENPDAQKFSPVNKVIDQLIQELYDQSAVAISNGAKLVSWTEGIVNTFKDQEEAYIEVAQQFAKDHQIWFLYPMATIIPGKVIPGQPFMENKVLTISPQGEVVNTYFKSIPVGGVEPCFPGDGNIPVISTELGHISPVICYDADFPQLLRQVGQKETELLIIPSGDWCDIKDIHARMAIMRGIENGVSILRPVSKGVMVAADPYGRIIATDDYFADNKHSLQAAIPFIKVSTIYSKIGDAFAYLCIGISLFFLAAALFFQIFGKKEDIVYSI